MTSSRGAAEAGGCVATTVEATVGGADPVVEVAMDDVDEDGEALVEGSMFAPDARSADSVLSPLHPTIGSKISAATATARAVLIG